MTEQGTGPDLLAAGRASYPQPPYTSYDRLPSRRRQDRTVADPAIERISDCGRTVDAGRAFAARVAYGRACVSGSDITAGRSGRSEPKDPWRSGSLRAMSSAMASMPRWLVLMSLRLASGSRAKSLDMLSASSVPPRTTHQVGPSDISLLHLSGSATRAVDESEFDTASTSLASSCDTPRVTRQPARVAGGRRGGMLQPSPARRVCCASQRKQSTRWQDMNDGAAVVGRTTRHSCDRRAPPPSVDRLTGPRRLACLDAPLPNVGEPLPL